MTLPLPASTAETVSRASAAAALKVGERQLRKLIRAGRLQTIGAGHSARIDASSLASEIDRRKEIRNHPPENAEFVAIPNERVPNFFGTPMDVEIKAGHDVFEMVHLPSPPTRAAAELELLPLSRAAAVLGLSDRAFKQIVDRGDLPSVQVGMRRRVSLAALRAWAMGQLQPQ